MEAGTNLPLTDEIVEHEPWHAVWSEDGTWEGQAERHAELEERIGATIGDRVFLARGAAIICESFEIGDRSFVASGCVLRDRVTIGTDTTLNPGVQIAGTVTIGSGVRIAAHVAIFGFNHVFDDPDTPIWLQGLEVEGITIEDDVWIGTHAIIADGVTVGAHSVVAAGAVVTKDVPPYSVVGGVPARVLRDRRDDQRPASAPRDPLTRFDERVQAEWPEVLARCLDTVRDDEDAPWSVDGRAYRDRPGVDLTLRATCDAVELAGAFGATPDLADAATLVAGLRAQQDPETGLFLDPAETPPDRWLQWQIGDEYHHYGVLSVGYALEVLDSAPEHPVHVVENLADTDLITELDALPWDTLAWPAGSWIDFYGTAVYLNRRHHGSTKNLETLYGWLATRMDPGSGMWGPRHDDWGWLMPVNGFYRLTRGTYAQFGHPLPAPEAAIDTVVAHCRDNRWFAERNRNACNVLDIVHPLWLAARQTDYRRPELRDQIAGLLDRTLGHWVDGQGFGFATGDEPGLQGTEMWLSIIYLMADYLGISDGLSWTPRGVHRLDPVDSSHVPLR